LDDGDERSDHDPKDEHPIDELKRTSADAGGISPVPVVRYLCHYGASV